MRERRLKILRVVPIVVGALAVASGVGVLAGWAFDIEGLKRLRAVWPPQTPVTAFCLALLGAALVIHARRNLRWVSAAAAACVLILQSIKVVAVVRGTTTFVDRLLFASKMDVGITVAPNTALCLVLLAAAIILRSGIVSRLHLVARIFAVAAALIAASALVGYASDIFGLYQMPGAIPMRFQTALTATVLALGVLCISDLRLVENLEEKLPFNANLLVSMFTLLFLIVAASFLGERQSDVTRELALVTKDQTLKAAEILSTLQDAETGQRGYLLTEDERFLEPYTAAMARLETIHSDLKRLHGSEPSAGAEVLLLRELIEERVTQITNTVNLAKAGRRDEVIAAMKMGRGKAVMDQIRAEIGMIIAARNRELRQQTELTLAITRLVRAAEFVGLLLLVVTGFVVFRQTQLALATQRRAREAADAANRTKSSFLASMSHELRTPMTGIIGMCDLLLMSEQTPEDRQVTRILARSAQTLLALLNDILDLSKIESGHLVLENTDFRLSTILEEAMSLFGPTASQKGLVLNVDATPGERDVFKGDPQRLQQILFNLIGNAIKFTERGSVTVQSKFSRETDHRTRVTLEVIDTGIGISDEARSRLFRDFEQEDSSTSRRFGGSGLGLSISRRLVNAMGGVIGVDSVKGQGSRFFFTLTLPDGDANAVVMRSSKTAALAAEHLKNLRLDVLLAEDTPATRHLVTAMLTRWGHQVVAVGDGHEAVRAANERTWDVILMDMQMPGMDGPEAMAIIRTGGPSAKTPIIAFTADAIRENHRAYVEAGANVVVTKPVDWQVLAQHIAALVDGAQTASVPVAPSASAPDAPLLDTYVLDETRGIIGDEAMVGIIAAAVESLREAMTEINTAVHADDARQIKRVAHKIKGTASQLGAARVQTVAESIEAQTAPEVPAAVAALGDATAQSLRMLEDYARKLKMPAAQVSA